MHLGNDLRHALRMVRLNPGFSAIAIATLAFGIGINTAIFSIFDGILLRPLGYGAENRLVAIHEVVPKFSHIAPRIPPYGRFITMISAGHPAVPMYYRIPSFAL